MSRSITERQIKNIISESRYGLRDYPYKDRRDQDGYVVPGEVVMSITLA